MKLAALSDRERKNALLRSGGAIVCAFILLGVMLLQDASGPVVPVPSDGKPATGQEQSDDVAVAPDIPVVPEENTAETITSAAGVNPGQEGSAENDAYGIKSEEMVVPPGEYFLLQFGVFGSRNNAETLRRELTALGLKAHIESRVVVGPYPDRGEAEAARNAIQHNGSKESIVVTARGRK